MTGDDEAEGRSFWRPRGTGGAERTNRERTGGESPGTLPARSKHSADALPLRPTASERSKDPGDWATEFRPWVQPSGGSREPRGKPPALGRGKGLPHSRRTLFQQTHPGGSLPAPGRTPAPLFRLAPPFAARLFCPAPKRSRRIFICVESLDILARRTQPR